MNITIRDETEADISAIEALTQAAFLNAAHSSHTEQFIVNQLRKAQQLSLSLVAEDQQQIVGHVAVSPVRISSGDAGWYGLGPISVCPDKQGLGIGSMLMHAALQRLKALGAEGCVLLGDPNYYARFGFKPVSGLVLPGVPQEYFQAVSFTGTFPQGEVTYHDAFNAAE
ncbi:GNAT family N-acetyltransferase [Acinetobacter pragensis]|uniref:GCN5 family acetyltransferase n=1 Tax=Acinetobacter pragensis TaxID=1806892 RepID=A0A151XZA1_9GAMM|nr:N-acetyltransferase [Acinetobacter pragensis]KYQ71160.1 GCN5 family acetyltransferase [Acinetobacter pragensis]